MARNEIRRALSREPATTSLESIWARMDEDLRAIFSGLESSPLAEDVLVLEETREMVNATMSQLPQHYREALEAKYVSRRSVREIAAAQFGFGKVHRVAADKSSSSVPRDVPRLGAKPEH